MKFKVHLLKSLESCPDKKISFSRRLEDIRLKMEMFYWGLNNTLSGEQPIPVRLTGKSTSKNGENVKSENFEVDLFTNPGKTLLESFLGGLRRKIAFGGLGFLALFAMLGIQTGNAYATTPEITSLPPAAERRVESAAPVIPGYDFTTLSLDAVYAFQNERPTELIRYHNNTIAYHTNFHNNITTRAHTNTPWTNSIPGAHTNTPWTNSHSNTGGHTQNTSSHINYPGGSMDSEYLY